MNSRSHFFFAAPRLLHGVSLFKRGREDMSARLMTLTRSSGRVVSPGISINPFHVFVSSPAPEKSNSAQFCDCTSPFSVNRVRPLHKPPPSRLYEAAGGFTALVDMPLTNVAMFDSVSFDFSRESSSHEHFTPERE